MFVQDDVWLVRMRVRLLLGGDLILLVLYLSQWNRLGAAAVSSYKWI